MTADFEEFLSQFQVTERMDGDAAVCLCPAHNDQRGELIIEKDASGKIRLHCQKGCKEADIVRAALKRSYPERIRTTTENGIIKPVNKEIPVLEPLTASQLNALDIPPVEWIVKGILPVGLFVIGAPSKYFKSYMALQMCLAVCTGSEFLGFQTERAACLYFDLESTKRRPRDRINQILGKDQERPDNFYIITAEDDTKKIGEGFREQVEHILRAHTDIKLIVVDVFQKIRPAQKKNQSGYDRDYDDLAELKAISDENKVCIVIIHHTRKMRDPSDVYNELSGSSGLMGSTDGAWIIKREKRSNDDSVLHVTGRDIEQRELSIKFNKSVMRWEFMGTPEQVAAQRLVDEYQDSRIVKTIRKLLEQNGGTWTGSAADIKESSRYFGLYISDSVQAIGRKIADYDTLFSFCDRISISYSRTNGQKREYTITYINN